MSDTDCTDDLDDSDDKDHKDDEDNEDNNDNKDDEDDSGGVDFASGAFLVDVVDQVGESDDSDYEVFACCADGSYSADDTDITDYRHDVDNAGISFCNNLSNAWWKSPEITARNRRIRHNKSKNWFQSFLLDVIIWKTCVNNMQSNHDIWVRSIVIRHRKNYSKNEKRCSRVENKFSCLLLIAIMSMRGIVIFMNGPSFKANIINFSHDYGDDIQLSGNILDSEIERALKEDEIMASVKKIVLDAII